MDDTDEKPLPEFARFTIDGKTVEVPAFTLKTFRLARDKMAEIKPGQDWLDSAMRIVEVIAIAMMRPEHQARLRKLWPELDEDREPPELAEFLSDKLATAEMKDLSPSFAELLRVSGFTKKGEALAASGSTETLDHSSPNLQPEASAAAIGTA